MLTLNQKQLDIQLCALSHRSPNVRRHFLKHSVHHQQKEFYNLMKMIQYLNVFTVAFKIIRITHLSRSLYAHSVNPILGSS